MAKKNIIEYEKVFVRNTEKKKLHIKVEDKVFPVKQGDKAMMLAGFKMQHLMDIIGSIDSDISENVEDMAEVMTKTLEVSQCVNDIIIALSGQDLLDYVDDELEYSSNDKMNLAMELYQMPQGVSNTDEGSFR